MNQSVLPISYWQLLMALGFILLVQGLSCAYRLGLGKDLLIGTARTFAQLFLMGYVLKYVFQANMLVLVLAIFLFMVIAAARIVRGRIKDRTIKFGFPILFSMVLSYSLVAYVVTGVVVQADPWWDPMYFIPLGGMVVGNSMSAVALALERLFSDLKARRSEVEMMLSLGADYREASQDCVREAIRAGMIPSINSMMGVGLVFLPGMMTGQILSGVDPLQAIRYQIVIMLMLVAASAMGSILLILLVRRRCFGPGQQLILRD